MTELDRNHIALGEANAFGNEELLYLKKSNDNCNAVSLKVKPLVSLVAPAYNEALIIEQNLRILCDYMQTLEQEYRWELLIINDGSKDDTGARAEVFAKNYQNVHVIHHLHNGGLGQALQTGFAHSQGDYIITLDLDLSYSPDHIERLLANIQDTGAKVVIASPYMRGGKVSNVPWLRRVLSISGNRFLSFTSKLGLATLTGMVRVYDASFIQSLNLKAMGMDVNPEVLLKARLLNARITEIPSHLKWHVQKAQPKAQRRKSSMKILHHTWATVFTGFIMRPVIFFLIPSLIFFFLSLYVNFWVLVHCLHFYGQLAEPSISGAIAQAFDFAPHAFFVGGMTMMLAIQLFSLGILAVQSKSYFEEIFHLGTTIYKSTLQGTKDKN